MMLTRILLCLAALIGTALFGLLCAVAFGFMPPALPVVGTLPFDQQNAFAELHALIIEALLFTVLFVVLVPSFLERQRLRQEAMELWGVHERVTREIDQTLDQYLGRRLIAIGFETDGRLNFPEPMGSSYLPVSRDAYDDSVPLAKVFEKYGPFLNSRMKSELANVWTYVESIEGVFQDYEKRWKPDANRTLGTTVQQAEYLVKCLARVQEQLKKALDQLGGYNMELLIGQSELVWSSNNQIEWSAESAEWYLAELTSPDGY